MELKEFFIQHPQVAIAFSGGVDSAYLLYAASRYATKVRAYYVKSAFQPQFEQDDAMKLAKQLGVEVEWLTLDVLADED
ncbi:MAG: 7-cyano-7-deazaguanine synthase, partial [Erysipelotrichaceae bacterium]|nr:7-cyano-7-deazaguanine synthase [Erysipelotrichaceae bacterium]